MGRLTVSLLGGFQVTLDGEPITGFRSDKARSLLVYLLVEGDRPHRRESLTALLWPEQPEPGALSNLRQTLNRLRRAIGDEASDPPVILATPQTVQLNPDSAVWVDVAAVQTLLAACAAHRHPSVDRCRACAARLEQLAELYRGEFLAGLTVEGSEPFETWLMAQRGSLSRQLGEALGHLAAYYRRRGAHNRVIDTVRWLIQHDPWREDAHRHLMEALALSGQRGAAVAAYQSLASSLRTELDLEPEVATRGLYERVRAGLVGGDQPPPSPPRHNLPALTTPLIGRRPDLDRLTAMLTQAEQRLVTLVGPPGVGKTRLSLEVATTLRDDFTDGVYFIPLAAIHDAALVAPTIAHTLGIRLTTDKPLDDHLAALLRECHMLLVLDNFEQVDAAAPLVGRLVERCPWLTIVVTSREPLNLRSERQFPVQPLSTPSLPTDASGMTDYELPAPPTSIEIASYPSVQLFVDRARAIDPGFRLSTTNASAIGEICARLEGLPLAIELAAARVKLLSLASILARLTARLQVLTTGPRDLPDRQQSLRAAIAWSYDLLMPTEQAALRRLAVFDGGFTLHAAAAVVSGQWSVPSHDNTLTTNHRSPFEDFAASPLTTMVEEVASLVSKSLIQRLEDVGNEARYTMLVMIRDYGLEQLAHQGESQLAHQVHADYFSALVSHAHAAIHTSEDQPWLERLEYDHANLRAALAWYQTQAQSTTMLTMAGHLYWFWFVRGHHVEGRRWLETALDLASPQPSLARANALRSIGLLDYGLGDDAAAIKRYTESLAVYQSLGNPPERAGAYVVLGNIYGRLGQSEAALESYAQALEAYQAGEVAWGQAVTPYFMARALCVQGRFDEAKTYCETSIRATRQVGAVADQANALVTLAEIYSYQGDYARAKTVLDQSLTLARDHKVRPALAHGLRTLAAVEYRLGNLDDALDLHLESLGLGQKMSDRHGLASNLAGLAAVALAQGQVERATRLFGAAHGLYAAYSALLPPSARADVEWKIGQARGALTADRFSDAWEEGAAMTVDQIVTYALGGAAAGAGYGDAAPPVYFASPRLSVS